MSKKSHNKIIKVSPKKNNTEYRKNVYSFESMQKLEAGDYAKAAPRIGKANKK